VLVSAFFAAVMAHQLYTTHLPLTAIFYDSWHEPIGSSSTSFCSKTAVSKALP
jgi:hypothetical protein